MFQTVEVKIKDLKSPNFLQIENCENVYLPFQIIKRVETLNLINNTNIAFKKYNIKMVRKSVVVKVRTRSINANTFQPKELSTLYVKNSSLNVFHEDLFDSQIIETIRLENSTVNRFNYNAFKNSTITTLSIKDCKIKDEISKEAFTNVKIKELEIKGSILEKVSSEAFDIAVEKKFEMSGNTFNKIESKAFQKMTFQVSCFSQT